MYQIGQIFINEYPQEAVDWCNSNECTIIHKETNSKNENIFEIVSAPTEITIIEDPLPSREELSEAIAELGDLVSALYTKDESK